MKYVISLLFFLLIIISIPKLSFAQTIVKNTEELQAHINSDVQNVDLKIAESFNFDEGIEFKVSKLKNINIEGPKKKIISKIDVVLDVAEEGEIKYPKLSFKGFDFDGENKSQIGFSFKGKSTLPIVINIESSNFINSIATIFEYNLDGNFEDGGDVSFENVYVFNNKSKKGGIINIFQPTSFSLKYSTVENNMNTSKDISSVISLRESKSVGSIYYSYFLNNEYNPGSFDGEKGGGAVFISMNHELSSQYNGVGVLESHFINNRSLNSNGGAIYIKGNKENFTTSLSYSVFKNNYGNKGGAVFYEGNYNGFSVVESPYFKTRWNLFMENKSTKGEGGAILINNKKVSNQVGLDSQQDIFYKNSAKNDNKFVKGGAISMNGEHALVLSRSAFGFNSGEKNFENLSIESKEIDVLKKSVGIDNGKDIGNTSEKAFGKYPIKLIEYFEQYNEIGHLNHRAKNIRFPLIPNISDKHGKEITGIASASNHYTNSDTEIIEDDIGVPLRRSLLYDANGGQFNLPELKEFDGTVYYEGKTPKYYVESLFWLDNSNDTSFIFIKDGIKNLNIKKQGHKFLGWSMKYDSMKPDKEFATNTSLELRKQKKLFAIWQPNTYQLTYYGTNKSSGKTPTVTKAKYNTTATIKSAGTMKRKGHKFLGWSTKANQTTAKYVAGKKMKVTSSLKLYPVWEANKYTLKYNNTSKTSGAAPKSVSATYGKSYTIKNAGSMKRKGYKFLGWSKKAKQSKVDAKLKPGKKIKVLGTTNLYPVWKKAK